MSVIQLSKNDNMFDSRAILKTSNHTDGWRYFSKFLTHEGTFQAHHGESSFPSCLWVPPTETPSHLQSWLSPRPCPFNLMLNFTLASHGSNNHTIQDGNPLIIAPPSYMQLDPALSFHSILSIQLDRGARDRAENNGARDMHALCREIQT